MFKGIKKKGRVYITIGKQAEPGTEKTKMHKMIRKVHKMNTVEDLKAYEEILEFVRYTDIRSMRSILQDFLERDTSDYTEEQIENVIDDFVLDTYGMIESVINEYKRKENEAKRKSMKGGYCE